MELAVEGIACGACIARIEGAVKRLPGVTEARLNFTNRRLHVAWTDGAISAGANPADAREHRLSRPSVRSAARRAGGGGRGAPPAALPGGRRLCGHEHHAAVGVGVVGQRHRHHAGDARFLPLGLGADRLAGGGLCRPAVLRERLAGAARAQPQHGCADFARRHPGAWPCRWSRPPIMPSMPITTRRSCCCSSCWSGARSITPCAARRGRSPAIWPR